MVSLWLWFTCFTFANMYAQIGVFPVLFVGWKLLKKTKWLKPHEVDLVTDLAEIEEYHRLFVEVPETNAFNRVLDKMFG
jgi:amino acid transporter